MPREKSKDRRLVSCRVDLGYVVPLRGIIPSKPKELSESEAKLYLRLATMLEPLARRVGEDFYLRVVRGKLKLQKRA